MEHMLSAKAVFFFLIRLVVMQGKGPFIGPEASVGRKK